MTVTVSELRVHEVEVDLVRPFVTAVRRISTMPVVLVEAVGPDGLSGWGEAAVSWRVTGESPSSVRAAVLGPIAEAVVGQPVDPPAELGARLATVVAHNAAARSAVECAVHDLAAASAGQTLTEALGGGPREVTTDMTLAAGPVDVLVARAAAHVADGFRTLKVKVGAGHDDRTALVELRRALGPDVVLRVDANQAWDAHEAIATLHRWQDAGVDLELVEQPTPARDLAALAAVTAAGIAPVLADESVATVDDLREVVTRRGADLVNVKLAKAGGLTGARKVADLAAAHGIGVVVGSMMESVVGVAAAAAFAASLPDPDARRTHDLDAGLWQVASPVHGGVVYRGQTVVRPERPGLGVGGLRAEVGLVRTVSSARSVVGVS